VPGVEWGEQCHCCLWQYVVGFKVFLVWLSVWEADEHLGECYEAGCH